MTVLTRPCWVGEATLLGRREQPMKTFAMIFVVLTLAAASILGLFLSWKFFVLTHHFAADAIGDAREMMGDGPQPAYWRSFISYLVFYIPATFVLLLSISFAAIAGLLFQRYLLSRNI